jgi:hypothetical protein
MTEIKFKDTISDANYSLVDLDDDTAYGDFSSLTGGDLTISMIPYNVAGENGGVDTRFLPGQISYAPIKLACEYDKRKTTMTDWFIAVKDGDPANMLKNCSINLSYTSKDNKIAATWNLYNVMPIALPGFSVHTFQKTKSIKFKVVLQVERIEIEYP